MSALCGIVDYRKGTVSFEKLHAMSRAMLLRGTGQSGAYINGAAGFAHNRTIKEKDAKERQPYTVLKDADAYTIVFDGELDNADYLSSELEWDSILTDAAEIILGYYIRYGCDCVKYFDGAFAFAILNEKKNEVFLARDPFGRKPLYYAAVDEAFVFASEIKGLLAYLPDSAAVSIKAYKRLMVAECGDVNGCDIYRGISELPPSSYATYTDDGRLNVFGYSPYLPGERIITGEKKAVPLSSARVLSDENLEKTLFEILIAFDYPQFDVYMLNFFELIKKNSDKPLITIADEAVAMDISYARERADRLGMRYALPVRCVPLTGGGSLSGAEMRKIEKKLLELAEKLLEREKDNSIIKWVAEHFPFERIKREKDIKQRIRMLGMICQTVFWVQKYNITFV